MTIESKGLTRDRVQQVFKHFNQLTNGVLKKRNVDCIHDHRILIFWDTKPKIKEKKELLEKADNRRMLSSLVMLSSPFPKYYTEETIIKRTTPDLGYLNRDLYLFKWHGSVIFDTNFTIPHTRDYILNDILGVVKRLRMALFISEFLRHKLEQEIELTSENLCGKQLDEKIVKIANYREIIAKVASLYEKFKTTKIEHLNEIVGICEKEFQLRQCQEHITRNADSLDILYRNLIDLRERRFNRRVNWLLLIIAILSVLPVIFEIILPYISSLLN